MNLLFQEKAANRGFFGSARCACAGCGAFGAEGKRGKEGTSDPAPGGLPGWSNRLLPCFLRRFLQNFPEGTKALQKQNLVTTAGFCHIKMRTVLSHISPRSGCALIKREISNA
jgi:hypothetical protein